MTPLLISVAALLTLALALISLVQLLYLESLRLRARDLPALECFKEEIEQRIGLKTEKGALAFSLIKHSLLVLIGVLAALGVLSAAPLAARAAIEAAAISVALMLLGAYAVPQLLYRRTSGKWLAPLAPLLRLASLMVWPVTSLVSFLETLVSLGDGDSGAKENGSSAEENLEALIEAGADEGLIEEDDRQLIHSVVALGDKTVRQVMTARPAVVSITAKATIEDFRRLAIDNHFSRFPVYRESINNILGTVHVRDIIEIDYDERASQTVEKFVRPTLFVPETKRVADLFREMQRDNIQLAVVVDEYGETAGIVTMEDVVEEVFGEIRDEYDPKADIKVEADGCFIANGDVDLDLLHELVEFRPSEETESTTVGGLVSEWLGRVPAIGESVERDGIRLEVTAGDERHVTEVRVCKSVPKETGNVSGRAG